MTTQAPERSGGPGLRASRVGRRLGRFTPALVSLADQGAVSGFSFLMGIGAARVLGIDEFGHLALVLIVAGFAQEMQNALAVAPMMTLAGGRDRLSPAYTSSVFVGTLLLCLPGALLAAAVLVAAGSTHPGTLLAASALILAQNVQFTLRRLLFARGEGVRALLMDAGRALAFAACAGIVWWAGLPIGPAGLIGLLAATALASCLPVAAPVAAAAFRAPTRIRLAGLARRHAPMARWLFPVVFVTFVQEQAIWIGVGVFLGPDTLGGLRATQYITGAVLLMLRATENVLPVGAARAFAQGSVKALDRYLARAALRLGVPVVLLLAAIAVPAELCLRIVFGPDYVAYAPCLRVLAAGVLVVFVRDLAAHRFRAMQQTDVIFRALIASLVVSLATALPLLPALGATGAALAVTFGHAASLAYFVLAVRSAAPGGIASGAREPSVGTAP